MKTEEVYCDNNIDEILAVRCEIEKVGFRISENGSFRDTFTFFDTQDGKLYARERILRYTEGGDVWAIERSGRSEKSGRGDPRLCNDPELQNLRLLPVLRASCSGRTWLLRGAVSSTIHLSSQEWSFSSPHRESWSQPVTVLHFASPTPTKELEYLRALLSTLGCFNRTAFHPLSRGLESIKSAPPGAPAPAEYFPVPGDTLSTVGCKALAMQAYKMEANTEGTLLDLDPEFLHDMRVATRRARFALKVMKSRLETGYHSRVRRALAWLASLLGEVRDLDVYLDNLTQHLKRVEATDQTIRLIAGGLCSRREPALQDLRDALRSSTYKVLLQNLRDASGNVNGQQGPEVPARRAAPAFIQKAAGKVAKKTKKPAEEMIPAELHDLRIAFKGLRYTCEFFADLFGEPMDRSIKTIKGFQDCLGDHQDAIVALHTLQGLQNEISGSDTLDPHHRDALVALGALMQIERETAIGCRRQFLQQYHLLPALMDDLAKLG
jgi:CHAD domain-containing protein